MISAILSIASSLFSIVAKAMGFAHDKGQQNIGMQAQQNADLTATQAEATNAQRIDATVGTESRDALVDELRGPTASR